MEGSLYLALGLLILLPVLLALLSNSLHCIFSVNEFAFELSSGLVGHEDLSLKFLILIFEAGELTTLGIEGTLLTSEVVLKLSLKRVPLFAERLDLMLKLLLHLQSILLGLVHNLILVIARRL